MSPLDRIAQLTERASNAEKQCDIALNLCESAQREVALLRSQLADARQQLDRNSQIIASLRAQRDVLDERVEEFRIKLAGLADYCAEAVHECCLKNGGAWNWGSLPIEQVRSFLSRHA